MATVTGVTAAKAKEIEDRLITGAVKQGSSLILQTAGGTVINVANAFVAAYETTPINGILMTINPANPSTYMGGGTWVRWGNGRVPVSQDAAQAEFDTVEEVGGAKTVALTVGQMPAHNHSGLTDAIDINHTHAGVTSGGGVHTHTFSQNKPQGSIQGGGGLTVADTTYIAEGTSAAGDHSHTVGTYGMAEGNGNHRHGIPTSGNNEAHPNLQPYIVCYMWKRTA